MKTQRKPYVILSDTRAMSAANVHEYEWVGLASPTRMRKIHVGRSIPNHEYLNLKGMAEVGGEALNGQKLSKKYLISGVIR